MVSVSKLPAIKNNTKLTIPAAILKTPFGSLKPSPQKSDYERIFCLDSYTVEVYGCEISMATKELLMIAFGYFTKGDFKDKKATNSVIVELSFSDLCNYYQKTPHKNNHDPFLRACEELGLSELTIKDGRSGLLICDVVKQAHITPAGIQLVLNSDIDNLFLDKDTLVDFNFYPFTELKSLYAKGLLMHFVCSDKSIYPEAELASALGVVLEDYSNSQVRGFRRSIKKGLEQLKELDLISDFSSLKCIEGLKGARRIYSIKFNREGA